MSEDVLSRAISSKITANSDILPSVHETSTPASMDTISSETTANLDILPSVHETSLDILVSPMSPVVPHVSSRRGRPRKNVSPPSSVPSPATTSANPYQKYYPSVRSTYHVERYSHPIPQSVKQARSSDL